MSDYIKREDAITELRKRVHRFTVADEIGYTGTVKWSEEVIYKTSAMNGLMSIPAADVIERQRGEWKAACEDLIICTSCKCGFLLPYPNRIEEAKTVYDWNFCPNCGAQMEN